MLHRRPRSFRPRHTRLCRRSPRPPPLRPRHHPPRSCRGHPFRLRGLRHSLPDPPPASLRGISLTDPAILAAPSYLASFADTLPILFEDLALSPALCHHASWPSSPSITLSAAHAAFIDIAPLLSPDVAIHTLLTAPSGRLSIALLHAIAGHRAQHSLARAVFSHLLAAMLSPASTLSKTA